MTRDEAKEVLKQIEENKWAWMKGVKRFKAEDHTALNDPNEQIAAIKRNFDGLQQHHVEETQFLIDKVRDLCRLIEEG